MRYIKENWKRVLKVVLPVVVVIALLGGVYYFNQPKTVEGQKVVELQFYDGQDEDNIIELGKVEAALVDEEDALFLGDVIDYVNENEEDYDFILSDPSEFGRMIDAIEVLDELYENTDELFWMIDSENNTQCIEEGFCSGIDMQATFDGDIFEFTYLLPEW